MIPPSIFSGVALSMESLQLWAELHEIANVSGQAGMEAFILYK